MRNRQGGGRFLLKDTTAALQGAGFNPMTSYNRFFSWLLLCQKSHSDTKQVFSIFDLLCLFLPLRRGNNSTGASLLFPAVEVAGVRGLLSLPVSSWHGNDRHLADHFGGKLHLGFIRIREKLDQLKVYQYLVYCVHEYF